LSSVGRQQRVNVFHVCGDRLAQGEVDIAEALTLDGDIKVEADGLPLALAPFRIAKHSP
jgi:hypothetical protein